MTMSRQEKIEFICADDESRHDTDPDFCREDLLHILRKGVIGYEQMTDEALEELYQDRLLDHEDDPAHIGYLIKKAQAKLRGET